MKIKIENEDAGSRLDIFLTAKFPDRTRAYIQKIIKGGEVSVGTKPAGTKVVTKVAHVLREGDVVEVSFPEAREVSIAAADIPLDVIYEDKDIIVLNKPAGIVVHPSESGGHSSDSLVNALMFHYGKSFKGISGDLRPGIVHRLDKDTSGVLVVAKNDLAMQSLMAQFSGRKVSKKYVVLVAGVVKPARAIIDSPIGRSNNDRKRMAISSEEKGRKSVTEYEVKKYLSDESGKGGGGRDVGGVYSLLSINLKTGRTHQIRVHMDAVGYPVVGDIIYGKDKINKHFEREYGLKRQFLHAASLTLTHPRTNKKITFESDLPNDLSKVLEGLHVIKL